MQKAGNQNANSPASKHDKDMSKKTRAKLKGLTLAKLETAKATQLLMV